MKNSKLIALFLILIMAVAATGCGLTEYDNYDQPKANLEGAVVHEGDTIRVQSSSSNPVELELWQSGYTDYEKIPVLVGQDGTFSSKLFEGTYKLTQLPGDGPWVANTDTIEFQVSGRHEIQFEVEPFYKISSSDISLNDNSIEANFDLEEVNGMRDITFVTLFIGTGRFTSVQNNSFFWNHEQEGISINKNGSNTLAPSVDELPGELTNRDYIYARIAVEIEGKEDALYSKVHEIEW